MIYIQCQSSGTCSNSKSESQEYDLKFYQLVIDFVAKK